MLNSTGALKVDLAVKAAESRKIFSGLWLQRPLCFRKPEDRWPLCVKQPEA